MKVVVIGCGPAGLAAAHAAAGQDCDVKVIGPKKKTPQRGPIMLHRPIPGINSEQPKGYVRQIVVGGSVLDYRLKLYGDVNIKINGDILDPGFSTWPVPEAYDRLWQLYRHIIVDHALSPHEVEALRDDEEADLIVSTAPAPALCLNRGRHALGAHEFLSVPIALMFRTSFPDQPDNTVIYNAFPHIPWVRSSSIFGAKVTEYKPDDCPDADLVIHKPLSTNCDCHPHILRTGRFGAWHNETWIDTAYYDTLTAIISARHQATWDEIQATVL